MRTITGASLVTAPHDNANDCVKSIKGAFAENLARVEELEDMVAVRDDMIFQEVPALKAQLERVRELAKDALNAYRENNPRLMFSLLEGIESGGGE